jgi:hypothetical protein
LNIIQPPVPMYRKTFLPMSQRTNQILCLFFNQYYVFNQIFYSIVRFQILVIFLLPIARRLLHNQLDSADNESPSQVTFPIVLICPMSKFYSQHSVLKIIQSTVLT